MNAISAPDMLQVNRNRQLTGLTFGILSALIFSIVTWGYDALLLADASAAYWWLKFILGASVCMLICGIAGWITAKSDSTLVGVVSWIIAGFGCGWLASRVPFEGATWALHLLEPALKEINYSFPVNMQARMIVVNTVIIICFTLAGALENILLDSARRSSSVVVRWFLLAGAAPLMLVAGLVTLEYVNQPFRTPIVALDDVIQFRREYGDRPMDPIVVAQHRLRSIAQLEHLIDKPYRIFLSSYDPNVLDSFTLLVDFEGIWAECSVYVNSPNICKLREQPVGSAAIPENAPGSTPIPQPAGQRTEITRAAPTQSAVTLGELPETLQTAPRYAIDLQVDYANQSFKGKSTVDYTNAEDVPLDHLYFRLLPNYQGSFGPGSLDVNRVQVNGQPVQFTLQSQDTVIQVPLPATLQPGQQAQLEFEFSGQVPKDFGGENSQGAYGIYNFSEGVMTLSSWYPILAVFDEDGWNLDLPSPIGDSVYSDMAFYTVDISVPQEMIVAATGVEVEKSIADGVAHLRYESGPMRDFALTMSPDFQVSTQVVDDTRINLYYLPNHAEGVSIALSSAADSFRYYNRQFGKYPYGELDVIDTPLKYALGVEFPGIILIGSAGFEEVEDPSFRVTIAHEVAHQWWYNVVGNDIFDDPWMDEALTTYSSGLALEASQGHNFAEGILAYWEDRYQRLVEAGLDDQVARPLAYFESLSNPRVYGGIVYSKGALFFDALRSEIGADAFLIALRDYYLAYQYQVAKPENLLDAFEASAGRQLDDLFQKWLYSP